MKKQGEIVRLRSEMEKERRKLARAGLLLNGSIAEVKVSRGGKGKERTYGPYYQWTFKKKGKTVTVNLSASQKKAFMKAIDNNRKVENALDRMRALSREILDASTKGVKKRKRE